MATLDPAKPASTAWHAIFPSPQAAVGVIAPADLATILKSQELISGKDFIVVDVRRTDFENFCIKGAVNLPAHSFYQTLPTIVTILSPIPRVIFHCNSCSPNGRGPRTAGWYADELKRRGLSNVDGVMVLEGGLKSWLESFEGDAMITEKLPTI
ncbi:hypothetical protein FRB94_006370 [Tulasnella sp. JGI-2019a]|nr:hypothetical protein FRB93_001894 [Tulasnella sp. JGI-2019a]KAG8999236.1 hypothetical protein FRB94_006370 [Tulasnella sp. JGI-2019a]KAG9026724.1 hypothetical protein FRB95_008530 [Tulasnella sp. JGI-2019a]